LIGDDIHWWFFTVHYLSICGGYVGGTEDPDYGFLKCERRAAGWRFRTDDPFIVNFLSFDGRFPVNSTVPLETVTTAPAFGSLVVGIVFSVSSIGIRGVWGLAESWEGGSGESVWQYVPHDARKENCADWFLVAATFLTISSALVTSAIMQSERMDTEYASWIQHFEAVTWTAIALIYVAFIWKLSDLCFKKRNEDVC